MYTGFLIYSLSFLLLKLASLYKILSLHYLLFFCGIIIVLGIYAIIWQQILKQIPLSTAMASKSVVLVISSFWGILFFNESIPIKNYAGVFLIFLGIIIIGIGTNEK